MVTIGDTTLPGVQTEVESANSTSVNVGAPAQVALVGQADLANGTAAADEVHEIRTPVSARNKFGDGSLLAEAVVDALAEGAYPVHAVATTENDTTAEDLSGLSDTSASLTNAPVREDPAATTFTINGTTMDTVVVYEDPADMSPGTDEVYLNPVTGDFEVDGGATLGNTGDDVDYTHFDYDGATDALLAEASESVDLLGVISENAAAVDYAHTQAKGAVANYDFITVIAGAGARVDPETYSNPFDSSRIQLLYPTRDGDDHSVLGAYLGLRARLGIRNSPMFKRMSRADSLAVSLSESDKENLLASFVVPLADESQGARVVEDVTTVTADNLEESAMRQVLHRLIVDYVTEVVHRNSERYIGELHNSAARNSLRSNIVSQLNGLMDQDSITGFTITVEKVDAMTASVDVGVDLIDPLRNIEATVSAGQIEA